ncbi:MAG: hypothetical protein K2P14_03875 [Anaeroplasmataceae bacterium]|nr:hypothetical protein [Anaeroplasmataceae bacterium]
MIKKVEIPVVNLETMREHLNPFSIDPNLIKYLSELSIWDLTSFVKKWGHPEPYKYVEEIDK